MLKRANLLRQVGEQVGDPHLVAAASFLIMLADPGLSVAEMDQLAEAVNGYGADSPWWEESVLLMVRGEHRARPR